VETVVEIPAALDYTADAHGSTSQKGSAPNLIRLSVGIEDTADLIADLKRGLQAVA
jgi:cystathionine beta-lyase/cystathionine gamma-synthase